MKNTSPWVSLLLLTCVAIPTQAAECRGVSFPDHMRIDGNDLTLNGVGIRKATFLKVNVYVAALYVTHPSHDPRMLIDSNAPQELILHFVRGVGVDDLTKAWSEGFARNSPSQMISLQARINRFNSWMTDIKKDQRMTFIRGPGSGIQVDVNGTVKGTIEGEDFARAFVAIWLGETAPNAELKNGLAGGACE